MGLEEKFGGDSLAAMAYFDSGLMMPQTVSLHILFSPSLSKIYPALSCIRDFCCLVMSNFMWFAAAINFRAVNMQCLLQGGVYMKVVYLFEGRVYYRVVFI